MRKRRPGEASSDAHVTPATAVPDLMLQVVLRPVAALRPNPRNARTHSPKQVSLLADSIRRFGFTNPVLIDAADTVMAGHGRLLAAKQLGLTEVPTLRLDGMGEAERRAYAIADNRLAELAGWDKALLALEFADLAALDFDLDLTGFDLGERSILIDGADGAAAEDDCPAPAPGAPVTRPGDLWLLGPHRITCGSALEAASYVRLLGTERVAMAFTDPPYNLPVNGHVSSTKRHAEFAMASGEMSASAFTTFLASAFGHLARFSADGAVIFVCMDWRHMREMLAAADGVLGALKNLVVWDKDNGGMGSLYRSKHELIFVWANGQAPSVNNVQLGRHGRNRTNVWSYPGQNTFHRDRDRDLAAHPTPKPLALVADAIRDVSRRGDLVLDPFGGSGTTLIAAEKTGRRGRLIELAPAYVDVTVRRWQRLTGGTARLAGTGETFDALAAAGRAPTAEVIPFPTPAATPAAAPAASHATTPARSRRRRSATPIPQPEDSRHDAA